ncbi:MAG: glycosyltransferase N-terminal domain-containing protein [Sphingobacteriia bacterium]|jgi:3-deoxy-D-manno-octulosonic-acid transferase
MKLFYQLFILLYPFAARCIAPFNKKAQLWIEGRANWKKRYSQVFEKETRPVIWMHCSSLGEFEQGLPLLESLKRAYPNYFFLVSFFSPSGYTVRQNHPAADFVCYLPMDSQKNAIDFLSIVKPQISIFIKYEFWHHYLKTLNEKNIPVLLVSAIFRADQLFFRWYGDFYKNLLHFFNSIFVQDQHSKQLLQSIGIYKNVFETGDTRFDQVIKIAKAHSSNKIVEQFCNNKKVIVAGSTWTEDDKCLHHFAIANPDIQFIIAPHEIEQERLDECIRFYPNAILYSDYAKAIETNQPTTAYQTLIINNMGMLSALYRYATVAFIGGGFIEEGVHNTLEAAVYGIPVVFGPEYDKYLEAIELVESEGAFSVNNLIELEEVFNELMNDEPKRKMFGEIAQNYVYSKSGATSRLLLYIQENRLLTN